MHYSDFEDEYPVSFVILQWKLDSNIWTKESVKVA